MNRNLKIVILPVVVLGIIIASSCSDNKQGRPWGVSDETIAEIVKAKLGCETMKVIVDNMDPSQTTCNQLGNCTDYADVKLSMEGVCAGRNIKASCILRLYRNKMGNYRGDIMKNTEQKN